MVFNFFDTTMSSPSVPLDFSSLVSSCAVLIAISFLTSLSITGVGGSTYNPVSSLPCNVHHSLDSTLCYLVVYLSSISLIMLTSDQIIAPIV